MNGELDTEKLIPALYAQVQVMDAVLTALLETHPHKEELRSAIERAIADATAHVATRAATRGLDQAIPSRMAELGQAQLDALGEP